MLQEFQNMRNFFLLKSFFLLIFSLKNSHFFLNWWWPIEGSKYVKGKLQPWVQGYATAWALSYKSWCMVEFCITSFLLSIQLPQTWRLRNWLIIVCNSLYVKIKYIYKLVSLIYKKKLWSFFSEKMYLVQTLII